MIRESGFDSPRVSFAFVAKLVKHPTVLSGDPGFCARDTSRLRRRSEGLVFLVRIQADALETKGIRGQTVKPQETISPGPV